MFVVVCCYFWNARAAELSVSAGAELHAVVDDVAARDEPARWGPMPALALRGRLAFAQPPVAARVALQAGRAAGWTRASWQDSGEEPSFEQLSTTLQTLGLQAGPEISAPMPASSLVHPYLAFTGGFSWVRNEVTLSEIPGFSPASAERAVRQVRPAVDFGLGVSVQFGKNLAADVEAGYTVCDVPAAMLPRQGDEPQVFRTGYGLNQFRIGVSVRLAKPLVVGTESSTTLRAAKATEEAAP